MVRQSRAPPVTRNPDVPAKEMIAAYRTCGANRGVSESFLAPNKAESSPVDARPLNCGSHQRRQSFVTQYGISRYEMGCWRVSRILRWRSFPFLHSSNPMRSDELYLFKKILSKLVRYKSNGFCLVLRTSHSSILQFSSNFSSLRKSIRPHLRHIRHHEP